MPKVSELNQPLSSSGPAALPSGARALAKAVSEFAARCLGKPLFPEANKVIHDAIWGTQRLYRNEVAILDTPLLQRLRQIHQTGFTYLTYPSVTHTRFDHTLGVLYQTDKLARALLDKYQELGQDTLVTRDKIRHLRVAALLHDCSHGPFSHTSEEYYGTFPEIQEYIGAAGTQLEGASASEVLAYLIITSEPFKEFLQRVEAKQPSGVSADWLAKMITGQLKKSLTDGHYQLILNGPFDADKLDYIFRDGHFSGLPLGVDLDRLYLKTEIHTINSLEQIVSARMNLTASLYHHHKIRACDCMLKGLFLFCRENGLKLCGRAIETAADFLYFTDSAILSEAERTADSAVREMLSNITNRRTYKRALVFSMNSFERPEYEEETEQSEKKDLNLVHKLIGLSFKEHRDLAEQIWVAAGKPGRKEEVWLDFPKGPKSKDLVDTFVNVGSIESPRFRTLEQFIPIEQWTKQYLQQKWRGHVFCRPEYVKQINRAAVDVLGEKYKVKFTEFAWTHANLEAPSSVGTERREASLTTSSQGLKKNPSRSKLRKRSS